jgi:tellurite resistance protein TehA-like permease
MNLLLTKVFVPLAIACGAAWILKQFVIVASGGGDVESPLIAAIWGTGMLTFLLACAVGTALLLRGAPVWTRVLAAVAAVPAAFMTLMVADVIVESVYRADGWFVDEVPLVLAALVMGALGFQALSSARRA